MEAQFITSSGETVTVKSFEDKLWIESTEGFHADSEGSLMVLSHTDTQRLVDLLQAFLAKKDAAELR